MAVACLGEALIDLVPPSGESPQSASYLSIQPGGAPLNIAVGLTKLGTAALFVGCLSNDAFGMRLASVLDDHDIPRIPGSFVHNSTRLAVVDHLNQSSPFRFYGDSTADSALRNVDIDDAFGEQGVEALYVGSLMMTNPHGRAVQEHAVALARSLQIPIFSDPNPRPSAWPSRFDMKQTTEYLLSHSTVAKLSLDDARALRWPENPNDLLAWAATRFDAQLFVTGGAQGCWTLSGGEFIHVDAPSVEVLDPTGAGDASFAALISQYLKSGQASHAELRYAAAAGALATRTRGAIAGLPDASDVREMLGSWG